MVTILLLANAASTIGIAIIVFLLLSVVTLSILLPMGAWLAALLSGAWVSIFRLLIMRLIKRIPKKIIKMLLKHYIKAKKAGQSVSIKELERQYSNKVKIQKLEAKKARYTVKNRAAERLTFETIAKFEELKRARETRSEDSLTRYAEQSRPIKNQALAKGAQLSEESCVVKKQAKELYMNVENK